MKSAESRRIAILERLARDGFVDASELPLELGCSEATIRRDLEYLQRMGQLRRTHGGAVGYGSREVHFRTKLGAMPEAKRRIAEAAAELPGQGQAVGFTGGTTTQQVARRLAIRSDLTVVTNSLTIAIELADTGMRIIVIGGELRGQTYELVGPLAEPAASQIHLDVVFVSVDGLSIEDGLTTHNPTEARTDRVLMDRSAQVVVVTDHTKLGRRTFAQMAPIEVADVLVTDAGAPKELIAEFERAGLRVILV